MRAKERKLLRGRLDREMRLFRKAGLDKNPTCGLLHAIRQALAMPVGEIAGKAQINRSGVFALEERELSNRITLQSLSRMAEAMGCKVVYGIVPLKGATLEEMAEERMWREALGVSGIANGGGDGGSY